MEDNDKFDLYVKSQAATSNYNGSYALTTKNGYTLSCGVKDGYYVKIACLSKEIGESNKLELKTYQNDTIISFMESNIILSYTEECLNEKQIVMVTDNKLLDTQKWTLQIVDDDKTYIKQGDYYLSYNEETMEVYTAPYNDAIIQVWNITPYTVN